MGKARHLAQRSLSIEEGLSRIQDAVGHVRFIPRFDPLEELICCILSQHSADARSFPAFTRLREAFPDWLAMEAAGVEAIKPLIAPAGLSNQKAKSIIGSLRAVREKFGEEELWPLRDWPLEEALSWLETLPGVGPKTSAIVMSLCFGRPAIPVDTHVHRVATRLGWIPDKMNAHSAHAHLRRTVPENLALTFHTALIQHGRLVCKAQKPACAACVLAESCPWPGKPG